ncbi:MAG: antibiotic biosynthesis monooxygenase [Thermoleophilia bacterium]|nr:antibiotic biosynthesis monooxygenase [Thermoleophilia bacterium]
METYTTGAWTVREGAEEAFVEDWRAFAEWASAMPGAGTLRLTRDLADRSRFVSFAPWDGIEVMRAWKQTPEFAERIARVERHTTAFRAAEVELVVAVKGAGDDVAA